MRSHRNPRPRVPKPRSTDNPRRPRATRRQALRATFDRLVLENPRLAGALLEVLRIIASVNRPRAMELVEAVAAVVLHSPRRAP